MPNAVKAVRAETRPLFEVLVVYEDFVAGRRAGDTCSFLLSQLGDEFEFRSEMWKFEILRNPKLVEIAAAEALEADVIIVASRGTAPLPREVTNWIERWLPLRVERTGALIIAQIEGSMILKRAATAVYAYLEKVAATAKMDFLPHFFAGAEKASPSRPPLAPEVSSPHWDELIQRPATTRHWGINE
jgi:hypothetical protein